MLKTIAIAGVVLITGFLVYTATRPDSFRVERATTIKAAPEKVFPLIDDLNRWAAWSPWEKKDPAMKRTFGPTTSGKGALYAWDGNKDVGQGSMQIIESVPPSRIVIKLDFLKPFETHNQVEFSLEPQGDGTSVRWAMQGPVPYFAKIIHIFFDMDKMVGSDFEAGLADLKSIAEK